MIVSYDTLLHSSLNLKRSFEKSAKISIYLCRIVDIDKNNRASVSTPLILFASASFLLACVLS